MSGANPGFKRIILISEREKLDIQYIPKPGHPKYPQGCKYSFNYRAFLKGRWVPLVRWDNSHQGCHIDVHGIRGKLPDPKRTPLQSFEAISGSVIDDLAPIRSALQPALAEEDVEKINNSLKTLQKICLIQRNETTGQTSPAHHSTPKKTPSTHRRNPPGRTPDPLGHRQDHQPDTLRPMNTKIASTTPPTIRPGFDGNRLSSLGVYRRVSL